MEDRFTYPADLTPEEGGGFLVSFPDIPEALTSGSDLEEALAMAEDCLEEALAGRIDDGEDIPAPSRLAPGLSFRHSSGPDGTESRPLSGDAGKAHQQGRIGKSHGYQRERSSPDSRPAPWDQVAHHRKSTSDPREADSSPGGVTSSEDLQRRRRPQHQKSPSFLPRKSSYRATYSPFLTDNCQNIKSLSWSDPIRNPLNDGNGEIGFVIEDVIGALGLATGVQLAPDDDAPFGEGEFFADLGMEVPARCLERRDNELGADVTLAEKLLVHTARPLVKRQRMNTGEWTGHPPKKSIQINSNARQINNFFAKSQKEKMQGHGVPCPEITSPYYIHPLHG